MEDLTPLYNKEFYLAYLCGENVVLPIPDGNAERYLAYLCGMDVTIPDVPDGRTETYLAYKCGEDVVLPDPMYRIEFYLAKWCGIDCEVPEPMYRIEYWLAQLANSGELKTVTGNPISVSDALAKPAESLTIEILPYQSGSGDPSPDNVRPITGWTGVNVHRTGTNVWDEEWEVGGINTSTGADNDLTDRIRNKNYISVVGGEGYYFNTGNVSNTTNMVVLEYDKDKVYTGTFSYKNKNQPTLTLGNDTAFVRFYMVSAYGTIYNHDISINYPSTDHDYHAYTGTTYSISWQDSAGTVYGGELDVTTGVLTVTHKTVDLGALSWIRRSNPYGDLSSTYLFSASPGGAKSSFAGICSSYKWVTNYIYFTDDYSAGSIFGTQIAIRDDRYTDKDAFTTAVAGQQCCYELATPLVIQLTPTQVDMLLGNNVLWNDVDGDMTLEYLADGPADDVDALQILLGNRYVNNGGADEATDREALDILLGGNTR